MNATKEYTKPADQASAPSADYASAGAVAVQHRLPAGLAGGYDGPASFSEQWEYAKTLATARDAIPQVFRNQPGNLLAVMAMARALNIGVWTAVQNIWIDDGKAGMAAELMHALLIRAGHDVTPVHSDDKGCELVLRRGDRPEGWERRVRWTAGEAVTAGLIGNDKKKNWKRYPTDMLWARCMSRLCRRYAPDVTKGLAYTPDELEDGVDGDGEPIPDLDTAAAVIDGEFRWDTATPEQLDPEVQKVVGQIGEVDQIAEPASRIAALRAIWRTNGKKIMNVATRDGYVGDLLLAKLADAQRQMPDEPADDEPAAGADGTLPCGCVQAAVLRTGDHDPGCRLSLATPPEPDPEPEPEPATKATKKAIKKAAPRKRTSRRTTMETER